MSGRGRGDVPRMPAEPDEPGLQPNPRRQDPFGAESGEAGRPAASSDDLEQATIRGRGGFRSAELRMIPANIRPDAVRAGPDDRSKPIEVMCNYIELSPLADRQVYQYRIDFEPEIDSISLRGKLFHKAFAEKFEKKIMFDGMHDARSGFKIKDETMTETAVHPADPELEIKITVKRVGTITGGFEMLRVYNMNMKTFLKKLGYIQVGSLGAYIHPALSNRVGSTNSLKTVRGFKTGANVHENNKILMNLESVHKLMQDRNVLECMIEVRRNAQGNLQEQLRASLVGKLVVTGYNTRASTYKIEDIDFTKNPLSTFPKGTSGEEISYISYYQQRYNLSVTDKQQPLLLAIQSNKRKGQRDGVEEPLTYLIPEFCNIAGLTEAQRADNRLKIDLVRCSQIPPHERVAHIRTFLSQLHENEDVKQILDKWGYSYGNEPLTIKARTMPPEPIGLGTLASGPVDRWNRADAMGSFDRAVLNEKLAKIPPLERMCVLIGKSCLPNKGQILKGLQNGFSKVGLDPRDVEIVDMAEGDSAQHYVNQVKRIPPDITVTLVIMQAQNKERYDAIKKIASVERGMVTQVVTAKLMTDERKASGAAVKIGIQVAAKIGGEPWYIQLPLSHTMICGYDTYHDTANRGRSFGAFIASTNAKFTRWFSKADSHDRLDELSTKIRENLSASLRRYREVNDRWPDRVVLYRDGVSDGQLAHVFNVEIQELKKACEECDKSIRLTVVVVNKRTGARFYMRSHGPPGFSNPSPGSVIDTVVTRKERYDFYLISQSTRNGTVAPTYYNIIHDESGLDAAKHQAMAYKMCFLYFNWSGTVRVPAPCQYAHKLALLCGEHLHSIPNANLDDRLHFL